MSKENKRPNILIIVSDQQSIDTISGLKEQYSDKAYGAHWLKTPHLDRMINKGMYFNQSHSTNPVCCPARSSLFTGRMAIETGIVYNNIGIDKNVPLPVRSTFHRERRIASMDFITRATTALPMAILPTMKFLRPVPHS